MYVYFSDGLNITYTVVIFPLILVMFFSNINSLFFNSSNNIILKLNTGKYPNSLFISFLTNDGITLLSKTHSSIFFNIYFLISFFIISKYKQLKQLKQIKQVVTDF